MNTIQDGWEVFKVKVIPLNASDSQINAMKVAFYGGANHLLRLQLNIIGSESTSDEAAEMIIEGLIEESNMFFNGIMEEQKGASRNG